MKKIMVLFCLFFGVISCGKGGDSEKVKVRYAFWDQNYVPAFEEMKKEFELLNPDIIVESEIVPWAQYWAKLEAGATGGGLADVLWMNIANFPRFQEADLIYDWNNEYGENIVGLTNYYADAINVAYLRDGKYSAIPKGMDTLGFYINEKLFKDAGVALPAKNATWEQIEAKAAELQPFLPEGTYALAVQQDAQSGFLYFVHNSGGYLISADGKTSGLDLPATIKGIEKYKEVQEASYTPDYASYSEMLAYRLFYAGRAAMVPALSVNILGVPKDVLSNTVIHPLPLLNGQNKTVLNSIGDIISASSPNPEAAKKWIDYMNSKQGLSIQASKGVFFPIKEENIIEHTASIPIDLSAFYEGVATNSYPYPFTIEWGRFQDVYERAVRKAVESPDDDVAEILKSASDEVKTFL